MLEGGRSERCGGAAKPDVSLAAMAARLCDLVTTAARDGWSVGGREDLEGVDEQMDAWLCGRPGAVMGVAEVVVLGCLALAWMSLGTAAEAARAARQALALAQAIGGGDVAAFGLRFGLATVETALAGATDSANIGGQARPASLTVLNLRSRR